ncbi:MAG: sulfatase-like hydrolase/transferase [Bacteroidota bacterium]
MKIFLLGLLLMVGIQSILFAESRPTPPNIVLIFADDLGYGDLSCYGSVWNQTPEIDRMAVEGLRFSDFYAGSPVCTPSRAGLMTGSYSRRVDLDLDETNRWVLFPGSSKGINPDETILPEVLKEAGYATGIFGKWHLGDQPEFFPTNHGFDYYYGIPYSNDMGIRVDEARWLPLMQNDAITELVGTGRGSKEARRRTIEDQSALTKQYTEEAIQWLSENQEQPFFLYLAHTMPHLPVAAREKFHSLTNNPRVHYGGCIAEISWSTGKILDYLRNEQLAENTLVIVTSDNGGAPGAGASNGVLRDRKGRIYEGGIRVPFIAWWPGTIEQGTTCHAPASVLDLYHTFASLANYQINDNVIRDGKDISDYFFNPGAPREPRPYFYWHVGYLMAVRYGEWKLNLLGQFSEDDRANIQKSTYNSTRFPDDIELYNLHKDPGETHDVSDDHTDVVEKIMAMAEKQRSALGQYNDQGPEVRKTISVESPKRLIQDN